MNIPTAPACGGTGCSNAALVQWRQRSATDPASVVAVFACGSHAISMDLAAHVHAPTCPGPNSPTLPACGCTVEPLPAPPTPAPEPAAVPPLPPGWA